MKLSSGTRIAECSPIGFSLDKLMSCHTREFVNMSRPTEARDAVAGSQYSGRVLTQLA